MIGKVFQGDCLEVLKTFPDNSIDSVVTSPPYWALRDYGVDGQLGLEKTFQEYINKLCNIFDEVKRVLKKEGTCWINLGDTYSSGTKGSGGMKPGELATHGINNFQAFNPIKTKTEITKKSLLQIPSRFAIEMTNRGWILRNEIIWHKPNCLNDGTVLYAKTQKGVMPSTIKDLVRLNPKTVSLWGGAKWNQVLQWIENKNPQNIRCIALVNGDKIKCTGDHLFVVGGKQVKASDLVPGDILDNCRIKKNKESYNGNIRICKPRHWNNKNPYTIISNDSGEKSGKYWDIVLKNEPHLFSTNSGVLIHNCMPSSIKDRFTVDFEKIFFFVKNKKYYFETQYEPYKNEKQMVGYYKESANSSAKRFRRRESEYQVTSKEQPNRNSKDRDNFIGNKSDKMPKGRNKRTVWTIPTKPYKEAHFATYPPGLIKTPILAGCPKGGIVLDPFFGTGTTGVVALELGRNYIGIELNQEYIDIAEKRLKSTIINEELF